MLYQFKCSEHGEFEVKQPVLAEHKANCPQCGIEGHRIYPMLNWIWAGSIFREDGSYREDKDYAPVRGG